MEEKNKRTAILEGLAKIPQGTRILHLSTPNAWLIYIEISPSHCYYIAVERKIGEKHETPTTQSEKENRKAP